MKRLSTELSRPHFSGLAGTGMSAVAEWMLREGYAVSGSDRSFDRGQEPAKRALFEKLGARITVQDGSGVNGASCLVVSTAIEDQNAEVKRAKELGLPIFHRSEVLKAISESRLTIAVSGTSGKSTATGMVFHILEAAGLAPSLITGANLPSVTARGALGNAWAGKGEWLVIEADESDGTLIQYHPEIGVILNIEKDHKPIAELIPLFTAFRDQTRRKVIVGLDDVEASLMRREQDVTFSGNSAADWIIENGVLDEWESRFSISDVGFKIPLPGAHNVQNAMAAMAVARVLEIPLAICAQGLAQFQGVERRHVRVGVVNGITVVDDFAHNPAKVAACLKSLKQDGHGKKRRVLAIFHPHGYGPMKFMGRDIMDAVAKVLDANDRLYLPEIFYAGGSADQSISSADLVAYLNAQKPIGIFLAEKAEVIRAVAKVAKPGDVVVSMGARDPALGEFARQILAEIQAQH